MRKIEKAIRIALLCLLCLCIPCMASGTKASAKAKQVTYTLKNNVRCDGSGTMKGQTTMTQILKVKESGTVSIIAATNLKLSKKQEVRMKVLDSKGKTVLSKKLPYYDYTLIEKYLKKGTYKIVYTTKNVKKNKKFTIYQNIMLRNKSAYANGKAEKFFTNSKGKTTLTFKNEKSQVVSMEAYGTNDSTIELTVTDKQGKLVFKESSCSEGNMYYFSRYMKKGTYYITIRLNYYEEYGESGVNMGGLIITPQSSVTSQLHTEATSWEKAVDYNNKDLYLSYFDLSGARKKQWVRLDTSDGDKSFRVRPATPFKSSGEQLSITNPEIKVSLYDYRGKLIKTEEALIDYDYDDNGVIVITDIFQLKKDTGVYYAAIEAKSSAVIEVIAK